MNTLDSLVRQIGEDVPARTALRWRDQRLSYGALEAASEAAAARLQQVGAGAGDRIAIVAPNVPGSVVLLLAAWRIGAVAVPLNDRLRTDDLGAALRAVDPAILVVVERSDLDARMTATARAELEDRAAILVAEPDGRVLPGHDGRPPGEREPMEAGTALLLTTSGSSGPPKAVVVSHQREVESASTMNDELQLTPDDATALAVSLTHAFGFSCLMAALAAGSEVILVDATTTASPLQEAVQHATVVHGSPTLFASLVSSPEGFGGAARRGVRTGFAAGAASPPTLLSRLDEAGARILNLYGMTEIGAAAVASRDDPPEVRYHTCGRALPGHELRVVDGELWVRGSHVTAGYFRQPGRTAAAFVDGWLRTGDLASLDSGGHLTITGRLDDVVSVAGFNVSPAEVETSLLDHPDVVAAVVVPVPHERLGHRLAAFVVPRSSAAVEARDLVNHLRPRLAGYKVPYDVEFMIDLPRLATGKPDRRALQTRAQERADR